MFGADQGDGAGFYFCDVVLGRGVVPHGMVHGGCNQDGGVVIGQQGGGGKVVCEPVGHLCNDVRACGGDDDEVSFA